ncbi:LOW QUALITY PROTEIN: signal transducing adapter molecule 2 [Ostrinia furnacalis]|uniref:LOW QUALITY PROTEIN: signal transducing adapter molecule 2 n=1 Tax=Ostrinia furnacalis TaxID=93504 RepID=UPI0010393667|nr:LOW QUALITY PROTEIN: signal transducing adapter molecule 2 [Ostrinia furnacalis]
MGIFGNSSPFDQDVERATSENNTSEEWGLIMEICDRAGASPQSAKDCLRAVLRRLAHPDPHVQVHAATLLDACVANCGRAFHLEVASRDFETELRRLLARAQPAVARRLRALLRKWAEGEFRSDPQLDLIPSLHAKLKAEGGEVVAAAAPTGGPGGAGGAGGAAAAAREQEELARAIALSLRRRARGRGGRAGGAEPAPLYPRVEAEAPAPRKVRALYDFEAAEDNELTFMAGEIVHVTDSSDPNWWKGHNERGEGLFPANFVTADLSEPRPEAESGAPRVKFAEPAPAAAGAGAAEAEEEARIDEATMDAALALLHEADPEAGGAAARAADAALARLEARVHAMGPLVDAALERADRRHARLTQLSAELVDALNLYHELMRDALRPPAAYPPPPPPHHAPPHAYPPPRC